MKRRSRTCSWKWGQNLSFGNLLAVKTSPQHMLPNWKRLKKLKKQNPCQKRRLIHLNKARVFLNGELIGTHDNPRLLALQLRKKRRLGEIKKQVNVIYYAVSYTHL